MAPELLGAPQTCRRRVPCRPGAGDIDALNAILIRLS